MRVLVVTAANDGFMQLLRGLVASLAQLTPRPYADLACFDLGLEPANRAWIEHHATHVVTPGWDLPVEAARAAAAPHLRAFTVRPFLPRYFPGYDVYLWIDADAWVQDGAAIDWFVAAAATGALAAVPEADRAYVTTAEFVAWRHGRLHTYFGDDASVRLPWATYVNAGVFALRADAPHWDAWASCFATGLAASGGVVVCDQTSLNYTVWSRGLALHPLPAIANWLCHMAMPGFDLAREQFCEPFAPARSIGIMHLAGKTKYGVLHLRGDTWRRTINLRFPGPS